MQHETARQLKDESGWHWVSWHNSDCRARGCEPHATADEAARCQYEHELANARERTFTTARPCAECKANGAPKNFTPKALEMGRYMGEHVFLCDEHRTIDVLRRHTEVITERWVS